MAPLPGYQGHILQSTPVQTTLLGQGGQLKLTAIQWSPSLIENHQRATPRERAAALRTPKSRRGAGLGCRLGPRRGARQRHRALMCLSLSLSLPLSLKIE